MNWIVYNRVTPGNEIKSLIRKYGIFPAYRRKVWLEFNNVDKKMIENQGYYQKMLEVHQDVFNEAEHQIDLDLSRTFPQHPFFKQKNSLGRVQMKRILIALSWRNPYVAYAQSLNFIVATLLLHCDEESAFWLLVELVEEILPRNYYNPKLVGLRIDSKVLDELIKNRLPKIHQHFQKIDLDCTAFCSGWFMRIFIDIFSIGMLSWLSFCLIFYRDVTKNTWSYFHRGKQDSISYSSELFETEWKFNFIHGLNGRRASFP